MVVQHFVAKRVTLVHGELEALVLGLALLGLQHVKELHVLL